MNLSRLDILKFSIAKYLSLYADRKSIRKNKKRDGDGMVKLKGFIDNRSIIGFKSSCTTLKARRGTRIETHILGLSSNLGIPDMFVLKSNTYYSTGALAEQNNCKVLDYIKALKESDTSLYFTLANITYICEIKLHFTTNNQLKTSIMNLYVPLAFEDKNIMLRCVTTSFPLDLRNIVLDKILGFLNYFN